VTSIAIILIYLAYLLVTVPMLLAWPRREVSNATEPHHWYLQWGAPLAVGGLTVVGLAYYTLRQRHLTGILPEHAAPVPEAS
jgi:hypothetical protein